MSIFVMLTGFHFTCSSDLGAPYCATYNYADPEWLGYTMVACYSVSTDFAFYASPFQATSTTTSSSSTTTTSTTTTSEPPIPPTPDPDPSVPVGPIVGGVVGGVGKLDTWSSHTSSSHTLLTLISCHRRCHCRHILGLQAKEETGSRGPKQCPECSTPYAACRFWIRAAYCRVEVSHANDTIHSWGISCKPNAEPSVRVLP